MKYNDVLMIPLYGNFLMVRWIILNLKIFVLILKFKKYL
jgi:hypothetical protein